MRSTKTAVKAFAKTLLNKAGYDLVYYYPPDPLRQATRIAGTDEGHQVLKLLTYFQVSLVLDVGANVGQFAEGILSAGYQGRIVSFEPLSAAHADLELASASTDRWQVHPRCALGDAPGEMSLNVASNSQSSSLLPMLSSHLEAAPGAKFVGTEKVPVFRLDDVASAYIARDDKVFLKLDVQGYEEHVLRGAPKLLICIAGMQLELSLVPLYDTETPFEAMLSNVRERGFEPWAFFPGFWDYRTGHMLQVNGLFFRTGLRNAAPAA